MRRKIVSGIMLSLLLIGMLILTFNIQPVEASGTITIRADGSIDPPTANITTVDNVTYTFTGSIYELIVVERDNIIIDANGYTLQGLGSGYGFSLYSINNVTIKNTNIEGFETGIVLEYSSGNTISGNNITNNGDCGIWLSESSNYNTIYGNNITNNYNGIWLYGSNNIISGNNITANNEDGISVRGSNNTISGNNIRRNNGFGIYLGGSSDTIYGNNIIFGNNITNNYIGIWLYASSNTISGNDITANNEYGIYLYLSSDNTISGNNITNNQCGIGFYESSNNSNYHNNFINNTLQVYDSSWEPVYPPISPSINVWDDGYPSGGNFWSDYTGVDVKSGPGQDQPGSDGIGDTAYVIDTYNRDRYPLMYSWGSPPPPSYTLTIYSSPTGVTFTVDNVPRATPWSGTYSEGASVSLVMPEIHTVGDAKYYWDQWSDGVTSRSRTVSMDTEITLTGGFAGPYYELTVASSPITGIPFTINGVPQTTPCTEWLLEGSYTLEMPETHNGYVWSHWLEDGDINRIKTITLQGTTWTAVYEPAPKPVGGKATPINIPMTKPETPAPWIWLTTIILSLVATVVYVKKRKRNTEINS